MSTSNCIPASAAYKASSRPRPVLETHIAVDAVIENQPTMSVQVRYGFLCSLRQFKLPDAIPLVHFLPASSVGNTAAS
jgi:hypothetical protein